MVTGEHGSGLAGQTAFAMGGLDAARELGGFAPALAGRDLSDPATAQAVRANATTSAIQNFAEKDALRALGHGYFGAGQTGEQAFAAFSQRMVQWKAFGDNRAYDMMQAGAQRHFERDGYSLKDAALKASSVIAQASADPTFAKLSASAFDQEQMLRNDLTSAQVQTGAMEGRRDVAGNEVSAQERGNVAVEQEWRTGRNIGQSHAAAMLSLSIGETSRRIGFINALSGEARASAVSQLSRSTGRTEAQVEKALETYNAASQLGTADGASAEAAREHTSVYARTREGPATTLQKGPASSMRSGKLALLVLAQRPGSAKNVVRLTMQALLLAPLLPEPRCVKRRASTVSFRPCPAQSAIKPTWQRAVPRELLTGPVMSVLGGSWRMSASPEPSVCLQIMASSSRKGDRHGSEWRRQPQPDFANGGRHVEGGLLNESQLGTLASGGRARFSFAHNDLLVSSSAGFSQSARSDTSTRFEAGKQAGPDTIEHFLGGGQQGHVMMENWLRGGFEMDRKGEWRLKPQVADTLERDVQAIIAQSGWTRSLSRSADTTASAGTSIAGTISGSASRSSGSQGGEQGYRVADWWPIDRSSRWTRNPRKQR
jgi:conjugal transfer mating pair stabilization protein TraG